MRKIGLWKPRNIFLACYLSSDDSISVVVDNRRFSISSSRDEISIEVQQKIPLHRRATLNIQGEAMRFSYWWPGNQTWPDDGDILSFIQRSAALPVKRTEFISSWTRKRE